MLNNVPLPACYTRGSNTSSGFHRALDSDARSAPSGAHLSGNADQLAGILADDFVDIGANGGRRTKQQNVEETRAHVIQWTTLVATNERFRYLISTTAVVTGEQEGAGTYNGQPFGRKTRYMRVLSQTWRALAERSRLQSALIMP